MNVDVLTISDDVTVEETIRLLVEKHISGMPVVDKNERLVGIISEFQLLETLYSPEVRAMRVSDVMITKVHIVHTYDTLNKAVSILLDNHIGAAPVLDKTGALVGMLSAIDLLRALKDSIDQQRKAK